MSFIIVDSFQSSDLQASRSEASTPARPNRIGYFNKSTRRSLVQELEKAGESQQGA